MEKLRTYLNGLAPDGQADYARRCKTSVGYLRKAMSVGQPLSEGLCIRLDRESGGSVPCEDLRPDVDWAYLQERRRVLAPGGSAALGRGTPPFPEVADAA